MKCIFISLLLLVELLYSVTVFAKWQLTPFGIKKNSLSTVPFSTDPIDKTLSNSLETHETTLPSLEEGKESSILGRHAVVQSSTAVISHKRVIEHSSKAHETTSPMIENDKESSILGTQPAPQSTTIVLTDESVIEYDSENPTTNGEDGLTFFLLRILPFITLFIFIVDICCNTYFRVIPFFKARCDRNESRVITADIEMNILQPTVIDSESYCSCD